MSEKEDQAQLAAYEVVTQLCRTPPYSSGIRLLASSRESYEPAKDVASIIRRHIGIATEVQAAEIKRLKKALRLWNRIIEMLVSEGYLVKEAGNAQRPVGWTMLSGFMVAAEADCFLVPYPVDEQAVSKASQPKGS